MTSRKQIEADRQQVEAHLRQNQRLTALSTLAGGMAHDFNNLIGILLGNLEVARLDMPSGLRNQPYLQAALEAGMRARDLIQRLFTMNQQHEEIRRPIQLAALIHGRSLMQPTLPTTTVFRQAIAPEVGFILGNEAQMHQALEPLYQCCAGHRRARGHSGSELLPDGQAGVPAELRPGYYVRLQVRDNGPGLPPPVRERLFEPFFTTKQHQGGTGLGLAIVHSIITAHHGAITVTNNPTQGATFTLYLPQVATGEGSTPEPESPLPTGNERILLVDNEGDLTQVMYAMLERLGYNVTLRTSSVEALEAFRAQPQRFEGVIWPGDADPQWRTPGTITGIFDRTSPSC